METKQRFYQGSIGFEGTGRDRKRHPIAVRLRSNGEQAKRNGIVPKARPRDLQIFESALGRTRTCDLLIRSLRRRVAVGFRGSYDPLK